MMTVSFMSCLHPFNANTSPQLRSSSDQPAGQGATLPIDVAGLRVSITVIATA
jgi:hypothetical protein